MSDKKLQHNGGSETVDYYEADVVSAQDYYPGGMQMAGRAFNSFGYRYGFQSQEIDKEFWQGAISFEYRIEDPRLVRFFSVDPLVKDYPYNSPYVFSENRLIDGIELEGLEWKATKDKEGKYVDFQWDADNAKDENGKLKAGYFETAIIFAEKGKAPPSGSADKNSGFHATATVFKKDGSTEQYDATTLPSNSKLFGTVEAGLYKAKKGRHPMANGYTALNVYTLDGSRSLPAQGGVNPRNGGKYLSGVNIHKTGKNDYLGTYKRENGKIGGISEGCFCIRRGKGDELYNDFIGNFELGSNIGIILLREQKPQLQKATQTEIKTKFSLPQNFYLPVEEPKIDKTYVKPIIPVTIQAHKN